VLMGEWFDVLSASAELPADSAAELKRQGFVVVPGPMSCDGIKRLADAYDAAVTSANAVDTKIGSSSTRVNDFVNRGEEFDAVYVFPPLLDACCRVIGRPFKLSSLHSRTVQPHSRSGELHVDVPRDSADWPLLSFILMVDDFRPENGATRFVPGSHHWACVPKDTVADLQADYHGQVLACGPAGSLIIFNGSVWHDHSANLSDKSRRSLQGAFVPRCGHAATDFATPMAPETRERLSPLARYLLVV